MSFTSRQKKIIEVLKSFSLGDDDIKNILGYDFITNKEFDVIVNNSLETSLQSYKNDQIRFFRDMINSLPKLPPAEGSTSWRFFDEYLKLFSIMYTQSDGRKCEYSIGIKKMKLDFRENGFPIELVLIFEYHGDSFCTNRRVLKKKSRFFKSLDQMVESSQRLMVEHSSKKKLRDFCVPEVKDLIPAVMKNIMSYKALW